MPLPMQMARLKLVEGLQGRGGRGPGALRVHAGHEPAVADVVVAPDVGGAGV